MENWMRGKRFVRMAVAVLAMLAVAAVAMPGSLGAAPPAGSSSAGAQAEQCLLRGLEAGKERIVFPDGVKLTAAQAYRAFERVQYKHPALYIEVGGALAYVGTVTRKVLWMDVSYNSPKRQRKLRKAVNKVLAWMRPSMSAAQKAQVVHDRLIISCEYDGSRNAAGALPTRRCTAYGCLVDGRAVCSGYAKAFQMVARFAGLGALYASSTEHAWNLVRVGKRWLHVDAAWDDSGGSGVLYRYFLRGSAYMAREGKHRIEKLKPYAKSAAKGDYRTGGSARRFVPFKVPAKTRILSAERKGKKAVVSWRKVAGAYGYELRCAHSRKALEHARVWLFKGAANTAGTLGKLGSKAFVQVRAVKRVYGYTYRSGWSKPRRVRGG